jgi:hypothetical protein
MRDIDALSEEPALSPEGDKVSEMISQVLETEGITGDAYDQLQEDHSKIIELVEKAAGEREHAIELLKSTLRFLPERGPPPECTCNPKPGAHQCTSHECCEPDMRWCELHDGCWDEPTLREEIEAFIKDEGAA